MKDYELIEARAIDVDDTILWTYFKGISPVVVEEIIKEENRVDIWYGKGKWANWQQFEGSQLVLRINNPTITAQKVLKSNLRGNEIIYALSQIVNLSHYPNFDNLFLPEYVWVLLDTTKLFSPENLSFVF
jgi:hypothetical protein